jgi:ABC 3 transport family
MDTTIIAFLAAPFAASLILTGIHAYLGVHVVERGVIFVDLSLAQIAALGATIALLLPITGGDPHSTVTYWISLAFTFLGALVFSTIRVRHARIPQEAIIGICYAVASAAAILAMSKATSESEHLKDMLVGNILAVSWPEVGRTALLYGAILSLHFSTQVPGHLPGSQESRSRRDLAQAVGFSFLRFVRFRRDVVGVHCGCAPGVLLSHRSICGGDAIRRNNWTPARHRLDDGNNRIGAGRVFLIEARPAYRRDDSLHLRTRPHRHGRGASAVPSPDKGPSRSKVRPDVRVE